MTHDQTAPIVLLDRILQRFDAFHVEVVRRLVENEQVVGGQREQRQCHARPLTTRQRAHRALHFIAAETEATEVSLHLATLPERTLRGNGLVDRAVQRKMPDILTVVRHRRAGPHLHATRMRRMLFDERLDEGALAGAVRAHERHHFVALEDHVHVAQQLAHARGRFHGHGHMLGFDHPIAAAVAGRQAQRHHAVTTDRRRQARHARQQLATSLRLPGVLTGQVARDVLGFRRDLVLLLVELPLLREPAFFTLHEERLVAAFVGERRTAFEVQHVIGHHREKRAIVADADDSAIGVAQILLEPRRRFEIEVIRRFVEEQDFRRRG